LLDLEICLLPKPGSRWPDTTVVDQKSAGTGTTGLEISIADAVDDDCDSDASTATNLHIQRGSGDSEKGLDAVAPFIEWDLDNVASTLEWRGGVLHSQEVTQVTSSRQRHWAEERSPTMLASLACIIGDRN
jgi:hypothetical protein